MRDEWTNQHVLAGGSSSAATLSAIAQKQQYQQQQSSVRNGYADSRSSQGLTRAGRQIESGLDRSGSLSLTARAMKLKMKTKGLDTSLVRKREVSERKQVGDAEDINSPLGKAGEPWWKNVTMEEGV